MNKVTGVLGGLAYSVALACASGTSPANAQTAFGPALNKPTAALTQFERTYGGVRDYTATAVVFERANDGSQVETRTYAWRFRKPDGALRTVVTGRSKGQVTAWHGGDTVTYREAGSLAAIRLSIPIDDPRAQTLRGDTIDTGTFTYALQYMLATPGTLAEMPGPTIGGIATVTVALKIKDPAVAAVTKVVLDLGTSSHLPVRRQQYVGSTVVKTETFVDTRVNLGMRSQDLNG